MKENRAWARSRKGKLTLNNRERARARARARFSFLFTSRLLTPSSEWLIIHFFKLLKRLFYLLDTVSFLCSNQVQPYVDKYAYHF